MIIVLNLVYIFIKISVCIYIEYFGKVTKFKTRFYDDTDNGIDELYTQYPELFKSTDEVLQMVVSNYIGDALGKRPLYKLTRGICEELGIRWEIVFNTGT